MLSAAKDPTSRQDAEEIKEASYWHNMLTQLCIHAQKSFESPCLSSRIACRDCLSTSAQGTAGTSKTDVADTNLEEGEKKCPSLFTGLFH